MNECAFEVESNATTRKKDAFHVFFEKNRHKPKKTTKKTTKQNGGFDCRSEGEHRKCAGSVAQHGVAFDVDVVLEGESAPEECDVGREGRDG